MNARSLVCPPKNRLPRILAHLTVSSIIWLASSQPMPLHAQQSNSGKATQMKTHNGGEKDFDFLIGNWRVHHRRLKQRLANSHDWLEFDGTCAAQKLLGGAANVDDNVLDLPDGSYRAASLRAYDPAKQQWSIWWLDSRNPGHLDPPVVGHFENSVGTFYADDSFQGKPIRVRFFWTKTTTATPHWEQAFSSDGGKTWETNWTMDFTKAGMNPLTCCPVLELRQYTLHPGRRDVLIELFEREFIESQEALGITLVGQFRDLDNPDRFVWLRGFPDMETRAQALGEFYGGPVWKAHRETANQTMIDSDNVLLLRPAAPTSGFALENAERQPPGATKNQHGLVVATICHLPDDGSGNDLPDLFESTVRPELDKAGAAVLAVFVTEKHPNTFPALPVRESANVLVWFSSFPNENAYERQAAALADSPAWKDLTRRLQAPPEILRLQPTPRSRLHG